MKLEYFGAHGRAMGPRMVLWYSNTEFENELLDMAEFQKRKAAGNYKYT